MFSRPAWAGPGKVERFEQALLPHLDAAFNLARWLTGNQQDAEDVVQEAYLRALTFFDSFRGADGRAWLLTIVRNTCYTWLRKNRPNEVSVAFDEELHTTGPEPGNPETLALQSADRRLLATVLEELPREFREVLILREWEGLSYQEIASVAGIRIGTVMSRLARARERIARHLHDRLSKEPKSGL